MKSLAIHQDTVKTVSLTHFIEQKYFLINNEINYSRFINIYLLTSIKEQDNSQILIDALMKELPLDNIYIKNLHYNEGAYNPDHFYESLKTLNSHIILKDLQDDKILNIVLKNVI